MKSRAFLNFTAAWLGFAILAILPLAGCDRDVNAVHAEKDAQGKTTVHVDGDQVDKNFEQAEKSLDAAGQQIKEGAQQAGGAIREGAEQAGDALQRGADKIEAEVGPQVRAVMDDAGVTAKVKAKLIADPEVNAFHIDVDTLDGRVTLSGKVASADQKAEAEKLASHTEGVKEIVNMIQVAGQAPPAPPSPPAPQR
ncbi:MAG TPA: BON domain-containing protein [Thermoanaerobaculia bacterium]|nr:BON domain-containing protein [Thermoanaerobaculia bacterium]